MTLMFDNSREQKDAFSLVRGVHSGNHVVLMGEP
jgi:hypothetical protein